MYKIISDEKDNKVILYNKPIGETSYDVIRRLKKEYPGQKIGHAGTLDPMAEGLLIILVGKKATKRQVEFMGLDKEYEFEVLFGFETDTYDILGKIVSRKTYNITEIQRNLGEALKKFEGEIEQTVPGFSAVKVNGKPLYRHSLSQNPIDLPKKKVNIKSIEIIDDKELTKEELERKILSLLSKVQKGFRIEEVRQNWKVSLENSEQSKFLVVKIRALVSKGTYVRSIANELGENLGVYGITIKIIRTKVSNFTLNDLRN